MRFPGRGLDRAGDSGGWAIVGTWDTEDGSIALHRFGKISKKTVSMLEDHVERRYHGLLGASVAVTVP